MDLKIISKHIIDIISVLSILLFPIYIIVAFLLPDVPEYYYSWFITNLLIATYSSFGFILFFVAFLISFKYKEKLSNNLFFMAILLLSGFFLIFFSLTWSIELYFILIIISGPLIGISLPTMSNFIARNIYPKQENRINIIISLLIFLGFLLYSFLIFIFLGVFYWRLIYVITGSLIILASLYLAKTTRT